MVHSRYLKGTVCLYCILFLAKTVQGVHSFYDVDPFNKYKNIHEYYKILVKLKIFRSCTRNEIIFGRFISEHANGNCRPGVLDRKKKLYSSVITTNIFLRVT